MFTRTVLFVALAVAVSGLYNTTYNDSPIWKVFCDPIYHGRVDSLVNPGNYSGHIHKVFGGNHFSASLPSRSPLQVWGVTKESDCTSCSLATIDNSNYWTADLFYQWPNGTLSLVPNSGLTIYYLSRSGDTGANKTNPNWQPIPKGLRMLAGNTLKRTTDNSTASHAISYVCLVASGKPNAPETNTFQTKDYFCANGFRAQVWFPMCWDGVNLDSPNHQDHMHYPLNDGNRPDGGDCPISHPVRIPGVFFEHFYSVDQFPHGDGTRQPFVWSNGDMNGGGFHGDFVSGWDPVVMAEAIANPACSNNNPAMAFGNAVTECPPLAPYVKPDSAPKCLLKHPMPTTENLGLSNPISKLPGCNPISSGPNPQVKCAAKLSDSDNSNVFFLRSKYLGTYLTVNKTTGVLRSDWSTAPTLNEMWAYNVFQNGRAGAAAGLTCIQNQEQTDFMSAQQSVSLTGSVSTWELWKPVQYGDAWAFMSNRANTYLSVSGSSSLVQWNAPTVSVTELFYIVPSDGGYVDLNDGYDTIAAQFGSVQDGGDLTGGAVTLGCSIALIVAAALIMM